MMTSSSRSASADPGLRLGFSSAKYVSRTWLMGCGEGRGTRVRDLVTDSQSSTRKDLRCSGMGIRTEGRALKVSSYWGVLLEGFIDEVGWVMIGVGLGESVNLFFRSCLVSNIGI